MNIVGLIVSDIPPFSGMWFRILMDWNNKWIRHSWITLLKVKLCLIELILFLVIWIFLFIAVTWLLSLYRFTFSSPGIYFINAWRGANSPSTSRVIIWKLSFKQNMCISLKDFNVGMTFWYSRWITTVTLFLRINKIKMRLHLQIICLL